MASEKQIQANRINALKGGVKTEKGKAVIRGNAVSHGFFSNSVLLPGEDQRLMDTLRDRFMDEFQPVGEMEHVLVERIVASTWRLNRVLQTERRHCMGEAPDYRFSSWGKLTRLDTTLERQIFKALHELKSLQKERLEKEASSTGAVSLDGLPLPDPDSL